MALLIINLDKVIGSAQVFRDEFKKQVPDLPIRFWPEVNDVKDIEYLAFPRLAAIAASRSPS